MSSEISEITDDSKPVESPAHVFEKTEAENTAVLTEDMGAENNAGEENKTDDNKVMEAGDAPDCEAVNVAEEIVPETPADDVVGKDEPKELETVPKEVKETELEEPMSKLILDNETGGAIKNETEEPKTETIDPVTRVIVTNKSSASLNNLLIYESSSSSSEESDDDGEEEEEEDSEDDDDENEDGVSVASSKNNVIMLESSSTSSCDNTGLLNELESSSSLSDEEELSKTYKTGSVVQTIENKFGDYVGNDPLPIPDVSNIQAKELLLIGKISAMVDEFVMVDAIIGMPPYDLETLMFLENGTFLGAVFDVMGPVTSPIYVLRFKSGVETVKFNLNIGTKVFISPRGEYTRYVFVRDLLSAKGSDASWVGDTEVPEEYEDFSDDEKEQQKKIASKPNPRKRNSLERHRTFENKMNKRNTMDTVCQIAKSQGGSGGGGGSSTQHQQPQQQQQFNYQHMPPPSAVPVFDPRMPPPPLLHKMQTLHPCQMMTSPPPPPPPQSTSLPPMQVLQPMANFVGMQGNWGYGHPQPPGL